MGLLEERLELQSTAVFGHALLETILKRRQKNVLGLIDDRKVPMKAIEASCVTTVVNKARGTYFSLMGTIMYFFAIYQSWKSSDARHYNPHRR